MQKFVSTFISGFQDVIPDMLKRSLAKVILHSIYDGILLYETSDSDEKVSGLPFFNNSFALLKEFGSSNMHLEDIFEWSLSKPDFLNSAESFFNNHKGSARIVASIGNSMRSGYESYITDIEKMLSHRVTIDRSQPDNEIWFIERNGGGGYIGARLTPSKLTDLQKGELRPELAYIMCALSEPNADDAFLDPFCGSGALVFARATYFPYSYILAGDTHIQAGSQKLEAVMKFKKVKITTLDARTLLHIKDSSIDVIVTDPPWGIYDKNIDIRSLYDEFLHSAARVLKPGGRLILLTSRKELMDDLLFGHGAVFKKERSWDILVSGKKARLYKIVR